MILILRLTKAFSFEGSKMNRSACNERDVQSYNPFFLIFYAILLCFSWPLSFIYHFYLTKRRKKNWRFLYGRRSHRISNLAKRSPRNNPCDFHLNNFTLIGHWVTIFFHLKKNLNKFLNFLTFIMNFKSKNTTDDLTRYDLQG